MSITSISTTSTAPNTPRSKPTIVRKSSYIDSKGNVTTRRRAGVHGVPTNLIERKCSTHDIITSTIVNDKRRMRAMHRRVVSFALVAYVAFVGALVLHLNCPGLQCTSTEYNVQEVYNFRNGYYATASPKVEQEMQISTPIVEKKVEKKVELKDDDKALQVAFETDFTCDQVYSADATQCGEKDEQGRTVRFFCPLSCSGEAKQTVANTVTAPAAPKAIADGSYNNYNAQFEKCAAVGSEQDSCSSDGARGQGCACQASSQCGAVQGSKCCYQGFCSYEHLAPLDPCM